MSQSNLDDLGCKQLINFIVGARIAPVRAGDTEAALYISLVLKTAVFGTYELLQTERRRKSSRGACRSLALGLGRHVPRACKPLTSGYYVRFC